MREFSHTIADPNGIHARPAGLLVQLMQKFKSNVTLNREGQSADAKTLFAVMKLRPKCGQVIVVRAEGEDEATAIEAAREFLTTNM
ncbi:MAG: HPr family phosphocarrier protein [Treponema sp.]|jgi:phosphotransferase system HPr (HPr) family protein|nr:HPr family phosphocarrier protein [Treponema sp.]